ncbi:MAG TPA: phosphotransferase family protein, partial [Solirubrobacterales bacterium]
LTAAVERALASRLAGGVRVDAVAPLGGGASREILAIDAVVDGEPRPLVLRRDPGGRSESSRESEFELLRAAHRHGVPVPEPVFALRPEDGLGSGFVMERVSGETIGPRIVRSPELEEARQGLARACGEAMARIHAIPLAEVGFLEGESADPALAELDRWQAILDEIGEPHPVLELALRRLRAAPPRAAGATVVHGDFRNGNLVVGPDGLRAVLDWELAHRGDPMEDLGWICTRAWRFKRPELPVGGFGTREQLFEGYAAVAGAAVDPGAVRFWEAFGSLKWAVICLMQARTHLSGSQPSMELAAIGRRACEPEWELLELLAREGA